MEMWSDNPASYPESKVQVPSPIADQAVSLGYTDSDPNSPRAMPFGPMMLSLVLLVLLLALARLRGLAAFPFALMIFPFALMAAFRRRMAFRFAFLLFSGFRTWQ